jgi:anti-sigma regulatory factor (Ser/Thr protein kinase)
MEGMKEQTVVQSMALPVEESSQTGGARRTAVALASRLGFDQTGQGKVGIVVTELANNLARHARAGLLLLQPLERRGVVGLELLALDQGPGIENISECLRDGYSTAGTPGNGLGAVVRLSDLFEIYSLPSVGTAILCRLWATTLPPRTHPVQLGVVALPKVGETVSGDAWSVVRQEDCCRVTVVDGLGHGILAAQAANEAVRVFQEQVAQSPQVILEAAHRALRSTRGAAMAVADIHLVQQQVRFAGVGNIAAMRLSQQTAQPRQNWVSFNGTVGHEVRKIQEYTYPWSCDDMMIMHSDGLSTQWRLEQYPGLICKHPSLIAGVLYRDFHRERDDTTILVLRHVS